MAVDIQYNICKCCHMLTCVNSKPATEMFNVDTKKNENTEF